jgi:hypothetical protein
MWSVLFVRVEQRGEPTLLEVFLDPEDFSPEGR